MSGKREPFILPLIGGGYADAYWLGGDINKLIDKLNAGMSQPDPDPEVTTNHEE